MGDPKVLLGDLDPESQVSGRPGDFYVRLDGPVYVKTISSGTEGWIALEPVSNNRLGGRSFSSSVPVLGVVDGGTGADLSGTGGTGQFVRQSSTGAAFTVSVIGTSDLPASVPLTSGTPNITGAWTFDTTALVIDTTNHRVGMGSLASGHTKGPLTVWTNNLTNAAGTTPGIVTILAPVGTGACDVSNPAASDFALFYTCGTSVSGRDTSTLGNGHGIWLYNGVLTATSGFNFGLIGNEMDLQNATGEGASVPGAWTNNGKVGSGSVVAGANGSDTSAGFSTTVNGCQDSSHIASGNAKFTPPCSFAATYTGLWKYGYEAAGVRTAAFYAKLTTNMGNVSPTYALLNDTSAATFIKTSGSHDYVFQSGNFVVCQNASCAAASDSSIVAGMTLYGPSSARVVLKSTAPSQEYYDTNGTSNQRYYRTHVDSQAYRLDLLNDAYTAGTALLVVNYAGSVTFSQYGSGTLVTDGSGNITASSDGRLKTINGAYGVGLDAILQLKPVLYHWTPESGLDTKRAYAGFVTQDVRPWIPEAVGVDSRGYQTLSDRPILAALVNGEKELHDKIVALSHELQELRARIK